MNAKEHIHFIGIGGIGMSGIARLCLKKGYTVSGSDIHESESTRKLRGLGASIVIGHRAAHLRDADIVVYSSAITPANPELAAARRRRLRIMKRAELLACLMKDHTVITVTGAHGKTTTSSLAAHLLETARFSPTVAVGGVRLNGATNAHLGTGNFFVAEADESDGTFLCYHPTYSIITNIDHEHLDFYKTFSRLKSAYRTFMRQTKPRGCIFWCYDDVQLRQLLRDAGRNNISFGLDSRADIYAANICCNPFDSAFDVFYGKKFLRRFNLAVPGRHNVSNALAVIALGLEMGIACGVIAKALATFAGVRRRFQRKYDRNNILIIDDYAHHPTEIRATLAAARGLSARRLVAVFQPHRYSRTRLLSRELAGSFLDVDHVFLTDIYSAGEKKIKSVSGKKLFLLMKKSGFPPAEFFKKHVLAGAVSRFIAKGDVVIFLGAGDINKVSDEVVQRLKAQR